VDQTTGLRCDQTIRLNSRKGRTSYPAVLRRISYVDPDTQQALVFLTNQFDLPALIITQIYRRRWAIELFFRWIKQHLRLRGFFSTSPNGVRVQIWTALCAYGSSGFLVATVAGSGTGWGDENRRARPKSTGSGGWSL
jgi:IS4 transposase